LGQYDPIVASSASGLNIRRRTTMARCGETQSPFRVLEVDMPADHYQSRQHDQAGIEARITDICATRVRYGYRRVYVVRRRED
jgi:hypothetical protein